MARMRLGAQLRHAWNAFVSDRQDAAIARDGNFSRFYGSSTGFNHTSTRLRHASDKTILTAIYTRMAVDAANVQFHHVRLDEDGQYKEAIKSSLNECLTVGANIDQASIAFFLDVYMSLFDNGYIAIVPTDTTLNPDMTGGWDVLKMRVGEVLNFYPKHVRVDVYNEDIGERQPLTLPKDFVACVYNPFHSVMNDGASVVQRLVRKLAILDTVDEASASGKLDMIIQLPYTVRGETKIRQAEERHKMLEDQLENSALGIGYIDQTEKVIQLNRPLENSLLGQVEYLIQLLYTQLGLTPDIMNGSADEKTMLNYMNRTIAPLNDAVRQAMHRAFLTKTARSQGQAIMKFWDPFQLLPLSQIAEIADKLIRNEVLTANELRPKLGFKPHPDPQANLLRNPNMPITDQPPGAGDPAASGTGGPAPQPDPNAPDPFPPPDDNQPLFDAMNEAIDKAAKELGVDV